MPIADDREYSMIALCEVEEVWPRGGRLEQGNGIAPMIAVRLAKREIMPAREPREIARRDEAAPRDLFEVAGELRPESGLERDFLAPPDDPDVRQTHLAPGHPGPALRRPAHAPRTHKPA